MRLPWRRRGRGPTPEPGVVVSGETAGMVEARAAVADARVQVASAAARQTDVWVLMARLRDLAKLNGPQAKPPGPESPNGHRE